MHNYTDDITINLNTLFCLYIYLYVHVFLTGDGYVTKDELLAYRK